MRQVLRGLAIGMFAALSVHAAEPRFTVEQLQQDMRFIRQSIDEIHPDPAFSIPPGQLDAALEAAGRQLSAPMSRDEAWRVLGKLNPLFADAHFALVQPDWRAQGAAHLASGGVLFPFEVQASADGSLFVRASLGGGASPLAGKQVDSIDGVPAARLVQELLQFVHGDTPQHRAEVLSRRWWFYYWKLHGAPRSYAVSHDGKPVDVAGSSARPEALVGSNEADFDQVYRFELLGKRAALMTLGQFEWPDKPKFLAFTAAAFARMREAGVTTLLIDVRENPGGDDDMWKDGVLPYIATRPYRHTSTYIKKVIPGRGSETERVGDIIRGSHENWDQPQAGNPLHFGGRVIVLVGGMTYSSAVLFSNVIQDFKFGQLAGTARYVRTRQSGGIQVRTLPNTGLNLVVPRMILERPAGRGAPAMLQPDIALPDDPFNRRALIDALLQRTGG